KRGGDLETENAVNKGLEWLAKHQAPDGSWSLNLFAKTAGCKCSSPGTAASDTAATALGLLPFLGAGEIFAGSKYHSHAGKALAWLLEDQKDNGSFRHDGSGNFYAHALATLALCETYGMTDEGALRSAAQQALDYIIAAQHAQGGWRYDPGMPGDLSVTGWQVMALRSGQIAHLSIPSKTLINADNFLDHVQCNRVGSTYGYLGADSPTPCRTAIGLLAREYLGWKKDNPGLRLGSNVLLADLPSPKDPDIYYWYYGTLVMHHLGGVNWHRWNEAMKAAIVPLQVQAGHETGSWTPASEFDRVGGRLYMTALAVCTLEVYYRYLPLYRPGGQPNGERNKR
ncbi:MAG TPA: prenyltransferase/squalene oxidase repeat-containing protein, partial [Pirellulales bacterium]